MMINICVQTRKDTDEQNCNLLTNLLKVIRFGVIDIRDDELHEMLDFRSCFFLPLAKKKYPEFFSVSLRCESPSAVSDYGSVAFHLRDGQCCQGSQNPHREIAVFGRYEPTNYNCSR